MTDAMSAAHVPQNPTLSPEAEAEMVKFGITRVPVDYFHWQQFRYTNLKEAVAQARRAQAEPALASQIV